MHTHTHTQITLTCGRKASVCAHGADSVEGAQ